MSEALPYTPDQIFALLTDIDDALDAVRFKTAYNYPVGPVEWHDVYLAAQDAQAVTARITKALVEMADSNVRVGFLNEEKEQS